MSNAGARLVVLSKFLDHTDGEFARLRGKSGAIGHLSDLASDALVTIAGFPCIETLLGKEAIRQAAVGDSAPHTGWVRWFYPATVPLAATIRKRTLDAMMGGC